MCSTLELHKKSSVFFFGVVRLGGCLERELFPPGCESITSNASYVIILLFFQVTSKVTHYFLIYKKISELLFQKKTFFPFID